MTIGLGVDGGVLGVGDNAMGCVTDLNEANVGPMSPEDALQRSHSTSSIHDILHQSQMSMSPTEYLEPPLKSRSSSYDDLASFSGSPTPTLTPTKTRFTL